MFTAIFGAGASYDADPVQPKRDPWRPPLTEEIVGARASFAEALDLYPEAVPLVGRLRNLPAGASLEEQLESLSGELDYSGGREQIEALRFYLRHVTWYCGQALLARTRGVTNYATVLAVVDAWLYRSKSKACLLTFNYDPLLDDAVRRALRVDLRVIEDFVAGREDLVYTKLHGSADWRQFVDGTYEGHIGARALIHAVGRLKFGDFVLAPVDARKKRPWYETFSIRIGDQRSAIDRLTFPALALPLRTKTRFACPGNHLDAVRRSLRETKKLLIVGWRAQEQHFMKEWEQVATTGVRADIVAGSAAGAEVVAQRIRAIGVDGDIRTFGSGFTDYVRGNAIRSLLSA